MVRNFLPLSSLTLAVSVVLGTGSAFAADAALAARAQAIAAKLCGPAATYDGPAGLFYPQMYKAENAACIRMVSRMALAKIAAAAPAPSETLALK